MMKQLPDGNYCLVLTPEMKAALDSAFSELDRLFEILPPLALSFADAWASMPPEEQARLEAALRRIWR